MPATSSRARTLPRLTAPPGFPYGGTSRFLMEEGAQPSGRVRRAIMHCGSASDRYRLHRANACLSRDIVDSRTAAAELGGRESKDGCTANSAR